MKYDWFEGANNVTVTAGSPAGRLLASPKFVRAYLAARASWDAEMEFDIRFGLFDGMKQGARNRKRKRFVRKAVANALKEMKQ